MGVLDSTETLPKGFETPIAPSSEILHLTPRSRDISPGSTSPSIEYSSVGTGASIHELGTSPNLIVELIREETRSASSEPTRDISQLLDDGPRLILEPVAEPPRESVFEPQEEPLQRETKTPPISVPAARVSSPAAQPSSSVDNHHRYASEDTRGNARYAHLASNMSYSATTPNPRTSSSPLQGALSFFSKIFTPIQELAQAATSSSPNSSSGPHTAPNTPNGFATASSSQAYSRTSSELPRANSSSSHTPIVSTRPTYVSIQAHILRNSQSEPATIGEITIPISLFSAQIAHPISPIIWLFAYYRYFQFLYLCSNFSIQDLPANITPALERCLRRVHKRN